MSRQDDLALLHEYTQSDSLRKHAIAVEAAMRAYARQSGEDEEAWGAAGLLHDFDYERFPSYPDHPWKGTEILRDKGYAEDVRSAILGHVPATGVARETRMARTLFACDELCGFIVACAMVRPGRLSDLEARSVRKKMKDKAFARAVSREDIERGIAELGVDPDQHIQFVINALRGIAADLDLQ